MYSETATATNAFAKSGGNYLIHAFCNDSCNLVLLDTGSVHSIAYVGCYKTLLYTNPIIPFSRQIRGANSISLTVFGPTRIELKINWVIFKVNAVVAKDVIFPLILGKDFLEENKAMINFERKELHLVILSNSCRTNNSATNQI